VGPSFLGIVLISFIVIQNPIEWSLQWFFGIQKAIKKISNIYET
jgi:hypothetical protein